MGGRLAEELKTPVKGKMYRLLYEKIATACIFMQDFPDETAETTLKSLWMTAAGNPCPAHSANMANLPELSLAQKGVLEDLIEKRLDGVPLAYLTGQTNFLGLRMLCEPGVIIPRPESELLCRTALHSVAAGTIAKGCVRAIEIGCGSGNLSCALAMCCKRMELYATDIEEKCIRLTDKNIRAHGLEGRVFAKKGDLFGPLYGLHLEGTVDIVVSNPPYIPSEKLNSELSYLTRYEPEAAFNGGAYGFSMHLRLMKEALIFLRTGGSLLFEFGRGQERQVRILFDRVSGYLNPPQFLYDFHGDPRVVSALKTEQ